MAQLAGADVRHRTTRASRSGGKCNCKPAYQASVWSAGEQKRLRKTFPTLAAARAWRAEVQTAIRRGTLRAPIATTGREAGEALVDGMRSGSVRTRSGDRYKPSEIRSYAGYELRSVSTRIRDKEEADRADPVRRGDAGVARAAWCG